MRGGGGGEGREKRWGEGEERERGGEKSCVSITCLCHDHHSTHSPETGVRGQRGDAKVHVQAGEEGEKKYSDWCIINTINMTMLLIPMIYPIMIHLHSKYLPHILTPYVAASLNSVPTHSTFFS